MFSAEKGWFLIENPKDFEPVRTETVIEMQEILAQKGYNIGSPDGKLGPKTRSMVIFRKWARTARPSGAPNVRAKFFSISVAMFYPIK